MNLLMKQKESHRLRKQTHGSLGRSIVREFGKVMYTLLYSKRIITRTCYKARGTQCCVPAWMGGGWETTNTCIFMAASLHCSFETITTMLIGYTPVQNKRLKIWKKKSFITFLTSFLGSKFESSLTMQFWFVGLQADVSWGGQHQKASVRPEDLLSKSCWDPDSGTWVSFRVL